MQGLMLSILCIFITTPSHGVIHSLVSTTSGTQHTYVCESELHTFQCTVSGSHLVWSINTSTSLRMEFLDSDETGHRIIHREAIGILLRNDHTQLQSALFVNYSTELFEQDARYRITCSSDTESDSLQTSFSAIPLKPEFTQILPLDFNETLAHYHLQWNAPANVDSTSIDHYILSIGSRNINVHSTQTDAIVDINKNEEKVLKLYGVDKCNQTGPYDHRDIVNGSVAPRVCDGPLSTPTSTESSTIAIYTTLIVAIIILLSVIVTFTMVIIGYKVYIKRKDQRRTRLPSTSSTQPL